jgi:putative FmdB family regulatory protein
MPLYEYACQSCGQEFEKMVRFTETDRKPECPNCHGNETHKKLSTIASLASANSSGNLSGGGSCGSGGGGFT